MSELSHDNPRESLTSRLITQGLGYCCEYAFWKRFSEIETELLSLRLGVTVRTVQRHKESFQAGKFKSCDSTLCVK